MKYPFDQWYSAIQEQPTLPENLPAWLRDIVMKIRSGDIHDTLNDRARIVPDEDEEGNPPRYSAVLILLSGDPSSSVLPSDASVLLTHRNPKMRTHSGQMAFPGGGWEDQDATPIDTAVREAEEETGLDPATVEPLAVLDPIYIDRTNFAVVPVLAYWTAPHDVYAATQECDWVAPVKISELVEPDRRYTIGFLGWQGPAFEVENMVLWGFTAGVVDALLRVAGWARDWEKEPVFDLFTVLTKSQNGEALSEMRSQFRAGLTEGERLGAGEHRGAGQGEDREGGE